MTQNVLTCDFEVTVSGRVNVSSGALLLSQKCRIIAVSTCDGRTLCPGVCSIVCRYQRNEREWVVGLGRNLLPWWQRLVFLHVKDHRPQLDPSQILAFSSNEELLSNNWCRNRSSNAPFLLYAHLSLSPSLMSCSGLTLSTNGQTPGSRHRNQRGRARGEC